MSLSEKIASIQDEVRRADATGIDWRPPEVPAIIWPEGLHITHGLRRLLRVVGEHVEGFGRISRSQLRRERRCVGCGENEGHRLEPVLGWVCVFCDEVLELVYEKEIDEVEQARVKVQAFVDAMGRAGW